MSVVWIGGTSRLRQAFPLFRWRGRCPEFGRAGVRSLAGLVSGAWRGWCPELGRGWCPELPWRGPALRRLARQAGQGTIPTIAGGIGGPGKASQISLVDACGVTTARSAYCLRTLLTAGSAR
jgi:hypothetical protein